MSYIETIPGIDTFPFPGSSEEADLQLDPETSEAPRPLDRRLGKASLRLVEKGPKMRPNTNTHINVGSEPVEPEDPATQFRPVISYYGPETLTVKEIQNYTGNNT